MRLFSIFVLFIMSIHVFADGHVAPEIMMDNAVGDWQIIDDRLHQIDVNAGKARIPIHFDQTGQVVYEFNVKYEDGILDDGHGGFGVHVFSNTIPQGEAWGIGESWLLWLNYDEDPEEVLEGLSAQVYRSVSDSEMELVEQFDLNFALEALSQLGFSVNDILSLEIPVRIVINGGRGDMRVYSPVDSNFYYSFNLPISDSLQGDYVFLRTNSMSVSFGR